VADGVKTGQDVPRRTAPARRPAPATAASLAAAAQGQAVTEDHDNTGATARTGISTTGNSQRAALPAAGQEFPHHCGASRLEQTLQSHRERPATPNADFRTGTSTLGSGEFEAELASVPPGDGGVGGQVGSAEDG
jgi:hypothetical protein